jgi:hypothetical protein
MSFQADLGVGPECYVSTVLFRSMAHPLELKIAHTGQNCLFDWLFSHEDGSSSNPYDVFCGPNTIGSGDLISLTGCGSSVNVTDCGGINDLSK